jgi:hypothetical protein
MWIKDWLKRRRERKQAAAEELHAKLVRYQAGQRAAREVYHHELAKWHAFSHEANPDIHGD